MKYFCRFCWADIEEKSTVCFHCGADQNDLDYESFLVKLIGALHQPEPGTPIRGAYMLGHMKSKAAIPALLEVVKSGGNMFVAAAALDALGDIGDTTILDDIEAAVHHRYEFPVRIALDRTMAKLQAVQ
jgi:HEAT repeat protein